MKPQLSRAEFCRKFNLPEDKKIVLLLPGSRHGEVERHLPALLDAVERLKRPDLVFAMALPGGFGHTFSERIRAASIQGIVGATWDALAQAHLALAASGTVTMEAAMLHCPLVTFYKVNALSWRLGRWLVKAPFLSMVNLVAGRKIAAELIQDDMTGEAIAREASRLLDDAAAYAKMKDDLRAVAVQLSSERDPMEVAAEWVEKVWAEGPK